jgi:DNA-binding transcriptional LysR family regulator
MDLDDRVTRRLKMSDLRMLLAVAQWGSMSKAAAHLHITQSAVSKALGELEHTLGVRLLDRGPQGVEPTPFGRILLDRGTAIFDELQQGVKDIRFLADPTAGEVRIGVAPPLVGFLFVVIERLSKAFPRMAFDIVERDSSALQHGDLRERKIEIVLGRIASPLEDDSLSAECLFDDHVLVIAGANNPWARRRKLKLADLAEEPWIIPPFAGLAGLRVMEIFRANGLPIPRPSVAANSTRLRDRLLATGRYLAVAPSAEIRFSDHRTPIKVLPVDLQVEPRPIGIVTLKHRTLSGAAQAFIEVAREVATD